MRTKRLFRWALAAALVTCLPLCTTSCMNHAAVEDEDKPYVSDEETILPVNMPAYVSAISEADYSKTVNALFPMRGSMDQAQIAVVTPSEIGTYNGQLYDLYQRGGLIVIARPDGSNYKTFVELYGLEYKLPEMDNLDVFAFAFNKDKRYYCIYDYKYEEGEPKDKSYYIQLFNSFGEWVNENYRTPASKARALTSADSSGNPFSLSVNTDYPDESYYLYWPTHVWRKVAKDHRGGQWFVNGDQDNNNVWDNGGYGGIRVATNVWYFYSFSDNANISGDYYLIQSSVTAENKDLWRPKYYYHGWEKVFVIGYFMTKMDVDYRLCDWVEPQFPNTGDLGNPSPGTTIGQINYDHGFTWGLNGSVSAGSSASEKETPNSGTAVSSGNSLSGSFGFSIQFSKTEQESCDDITIMNDSNGGKGYVSYSYQISNFHPGTDWDKEKERQHGNGYPVVSWSDMGTHASWLWRVPKGTHGDKGQHIVQERSDSHFDIQVTVVPKYGTNHWWRAQAGKHFFDDDWPNSDIHNTYESLVAKIHLSHPIRIPFGGLAIKNGYTHDIVMRNIKVWDKKANVLQGTPLLTIPSTYSPGETVKIVLEADREYKVSYELLDTSSQTEELIGLYEYSGINIHKGEDENSATTIISILDGHAKKIQ